MCSQHPQISSNVVELTTFFSSFQPGDWKIYFALDISFNLCLILFTFDRYDFCNICGEYLLFKAYYCKLCGMVISE